MMKISLPPLVSTMAILTLLTVAPLVYIIIAMTANTGAFYFLCIQVSGMAGVTISLLMLTGKTIFCITKMIECAFLPFLFIMTGVTLLPITLTMYVIKGMATDALFGGILKAVVNMA